MTTTDDERVWRDAYDEAVKALYPYAVRGHLRVTLNEAAQAHANEVVAAFLAEREAAAYSRVSLAGFRNPGDGGWTK
jgi:hypothetical protein